MLHSAVQLYNQAKLQALQSGQSAGVSVTTALTLTSPPPFKSALSLPKRGEKIAADRCLSSAKRSTFKLSLVFFSWYVGCNSCSFRPITKTRSYPARINIQGYRCGLLQQSATGKSPALSAPSCLACAGEVAHLCCSGSDCVREPECVYCPFYSSFRLTHTHKTSSPFYLCSALPPSISHSTETDEGQGWEGGHLDHRGLFVWELFIWFPSSLHTEHIML